MIALLAGFVLALVLFGAVRRLGSVALRLSAWLLVPPGLAAALGLAGGPSGAEQLGALLLLPLAAALWLAGHRLFAVRRGHYHSRLAERVLSRHAARGRRTAGEETWPAGDPPAA